MATSRDIASPRTARLAALCGIVALLLVGCGTAHSGATWWSPATWLSHSEATASDKATARVSSDEKRVQGSESKTIIAARDETHRTAAVLSLAPQQNPAVAMAARTNGNAAAMLDEVKGPPTADSLRNMNEWAAKVLSDAPTAEAEQKAVETRNTTASKELREARETLNQARAALAAAQAELREAFDRENALANQLRNERLVKWGCATLAVLGLLGWLYLKIVTGGLITGVGTALADLKGTSDASTYKAAVNALDVNLTPALQAKIAAAKLKATFAAATISST